MTTKPLAGLREFGDLQRSAPSLFQRAFALRPAVGAVGKDMMQPREGVADRFRDIGSAVASLDIGGINDQADRKADFIHHDYAAGV